MSSCWGAFAENARTASCRRARICGAADCAVAPQQRDKTFHPEFLSRRIERFNHAIREQHQMIVRLQLDSRGFVLRPGKKPQNHPSGSQFLHRTIAPQKKRRIMPCIDIGAIAVGVQDAEEKSYETVACASLHKLRLTLPMMEGSGASQNVCAEKIPWISEARRAADIPFPATSPSAKPNRPSSRSK